MTIIYKDKIYKNVKMQNIIATDRMVKVPFILSFLEVFFNMVITRWQLEADYVLVIKADLFHFQ